METQNLNLEPEAGSEKKSKNNGKAKKVAGESAKFAAAAGLGVAGTMAAAAMTDPTDEDVEEVVEETDADGAAEATAVETVAEDTTPVNPNDVRLDDEPHVVHHIHHNAPATEEEHQTTVTPVTQETEDNDTEHVATVDIDDPDGDIISGDDNVAVIDGEGNIGGEEEDNAGLPDEVPLTDVTTEHDDMACGDDMMDDVIA